MNIKKWLLKFGILSTTLASSLTVLSCSFDQDESNENPNNDSEGDGGGDSGSDGGGGGGIPDRPKPSDDRFYRGDIDAGNRVINSKTNYAKMPQSAIDIIHEGILTQSDIIVGQIVSMTYNAEGYSLYKLYGDKKVITLRELFKVTWTRGMIKAFNSSDPDGKGYRAEVNGSIVVFEYLINYNGSENISPLLWIDGECAKPSTRQNPVFTPLEW